MSERSGKKTFSTQIITLPISAIVAQREPSAAVRKSKCYKQIASSLAHIGLIEPLVVFSREDGTLLLVDGNTRLFILKSQGAKEVACIVTSDDEAYTYNKRVSPIPPISQHYMLLRVLENGVSEARVAAALNIDVKAVHRKRDLLKGICPEVVRILEGHRLSERAFAALRKMKPLRQIEAAEHLVVSNNYTVSFLKSILLITRPEMLNSPLPKGAGSDRTLPPGSALEKEHQGLLKGLKAVESSLGIDMLAMAVSKKYLERVLSTQSVVEYLGQNHSETLALLKGFVQVSGSTKHHAA